MTDDPYRLFGRPPIWPESLAAQRYGVGRRRLGGEDPLDQAAAYIRRLEEALEATRHEAAGRERAMAEHQRELAEQGRKLAERDRELAVRQRALAERDRELASRQRELAERDRELAMREHELDERGRKAQGRELVERAQALVAREAESSAGPGAERPAADGSDGTAAPAGHAEEIEERDQRIRRLELAVVDAQNELEAAKERIRRDAARELEQGRRGVLIRFLAVLDDLDRALAAGRAHLDSPNPGSHSPLIPRVEHPDRSLVEGVELVRRNFLAALEEHGVRHDPADGERFDPARHQAISTIDRDDGEEGTIAAVVREGYRIGDETLRPASVVVRTRRRGQAAS